MVKVSACGGSVISERAMNARRPLLISGEVGDCLIHLVGDRFVLTTLVRQLVCNDKGRENVLVGTIVSQVERTRRELMPLLCRISFSDKVDDPP